MSACLYSIFREVYHNLSQHSAVGTYYFLTIANIHVPHNRRIERAQTPYQPVYTYLFYMRSL